MTKEEKKAKKAQKKAEGKGLVAEFKAFISRGNVLDMAVGVIIGGAFNAIVTAFVNILMSVCTWRVPGGIKGLVTVLPAANAAQEGLAGIGQKFDASQLQELGKVLAETNYAEQIAANPNYLLENPNLIEAAKTTITSKYTLHGTTYTYNLSAVIDWGTFINAVLSFLIIAVTLFIIIKVAARMSRMRQELQAKAHKEEPVEEQPAE